MTEKKHSVLVTGASRGIGKAITLELARQGFNIVLNFRRQKHEAQAVLEEIESLGQQARLLPFDVSDREQAVSAIEKDIEIHGAYYGVVCNAGITRDNTFPSMSGEEWDDVIKTNLGGFYNVVQPCIMPMVRTKQGGRIVTLSSVAGLVGNRGQVNYSASKGGIISATKSLAIELGKRKITVNCVAPGVIETEMTEDINRQYIKEMIPLRRKGKPEEVSSVVGFLFSEGAAYITRQVISVNGGMVG